MLLIGRGLNQEKRLTSEKRILRDIISACSFEFTIYKLHRGVVQLVERWSPKPNVVGSSPTAPVIKIQLLAESFFYAFD